MRNSQGREGGQQRTGSFGYVELLLYSDVHLKHHSNTSRAHWNPYCVEMIYLLRFISFWSNLELIYQEIIRGLAFVLEKPFSGIITYTCTLVGFWISPNLFYNLHTNKHEEWSWSPYFDQGRFCGTSNSSKFCRQNAESKNRTLEIKNKSFKCYAWQFASKPGIVPLWRFQAQLQQKRHQ